MEVLNINESKNYIGGSRLSATAWGVLIGGVTSFFLGFFNGITGRASNACSR